MQPTAIPTSLLRTKLYMPVARSDLISRPRLTTRLDEALRYPLTLISAPAGFGKTTLVADWAVQTQRPALSTIHSPYICWLSLDEGDNDPTTFWTYVTAALDSVYSGVAEPVLNTLRSAHRIPIEAVLTGLINALAQLDRELVLILDDYHVIHAQPIHDALQFLVEHRPARLHILLLTRIDPPLPLARWRGRGHLLEVRVAELRFTPEEAVAFLNQTMGLALTAEQSAVLEARTEGWIAGLQMAALSMRGHSDFTGFIDSFTGSHRVVLDYLIDEVLQRQPEHVQTFLLQTAILNRLNHALCNAVTGRDDSRALLHRLAQENLFLTPLDASHTWWRYHHLFSEMLRSRLHEAQPDLVSELQRRAAIWFAQNGMPSEAIHHALAAVDFALAAELIEQHADDLLKHGEHRTLEGWLARLPTAVLEAHPRLLIAHAAALVVLHQVERAARDLDAAERGIQHVAPALRQRIVGELMALRTHIASLQDNMPRAVILAHQALAELPPEAVRLRGEVMFRLGVAHAWQGQVAEATLAHTEAKRLGLESNDIHTSLMAMANLGAMQGMQGHLRHTQTIYLETLAWATKHDTHQIPILGMVHAELGRLYYELNELDQAAERIAEAIRYGKRGGLPRVQVDCHIILALVLQAFGDRSGAQVAIRQAEQVIEQYRLPLRYSGFAMRVKMILSLADGDLAAMASWVEERGVTVTEELDYPHEEERMALAYLLVAQGNYAHAVAFLARLHQFAEGQGRFYQVIHMLALKAKALYLMGDHTQALATLERALTLAAPGGPVCFFVDQDSAMYSLLMQFSLGSAPPHLRTYAHKFAG